MQVQDLRDTKHQEGVFATAVLLRLLEELDFRHISPELSCSLDNIDITAFEEVRRVNYVEFMDSLLLVTTSHTLNTPTRLTQASYWAALRQEAYRSFTQHEAPRIALFSEYCIRPSRTNTLVMHVIEVAKWRWRDVDNDEWRKLKSSSSLIRSHLELSPNFLILTNH